MQIQVRENLFLFGALVFKRVPAESTRQSFGKGHIDLVSRQYLHNHYL